MWLWWVMSLIILVSCIIFAYRMIISSYDFLPVDKRFFLKFGKSAKPELSRPHINHDRHRIIKNRLPSFEENNSFFQVQLSKFEERLKSVEDLLSSGNITKKLPANDEEDWKEMYYTENEAKQKLENELDLLQQKSDEVQAGLNTSELEEWKEMYYEENQRKLQIENELEAANEKLKEVQSLLHDQSEKSLTFFELQKDYDKSIDDINSLKNTIYRLQAQLTASIERENELENLLISDIIIREKYTVLQSKYTQLQIEVNDLRKRVVEHAEKEINLEIQLMHLSEVESRLAITESENTKLKSRLENYLLG